MSSGTPLPPGSAEDVEATDVVAEMTSAVQRVRQMAATVFDGDAALFASETAEDFGK
jgi:hypothetical protein